MNRECPYVAATDKGGHMSLPIQLNGPHPTCSVNEYNESDSVKHVHSLPLMRIYIGDIKSFWLVLDVMQISVLSRR